jgi:hypothetical protein
MVTVVTPQDCVSAAQSHMLTTSGAKSSEMLRLTQPDNRGRRSFWAALILCAVCMLTVRVATRYCFTHEAAEPGSASVHQHRPPDLGSQRMTKSSPEWMPPVVSTVVLESPTFYPRIAPAGPPLPGLVFDASLYNRPPPVS